VTNSESNLARFPGGELVAKGLQDLARQLCSEEALLVSIAAPKLLLLGFQVPELTGVRAPYEHALYEKLEGRLPHGAHSAYNALISRMVSFANCYRPDQD